MLNIGILISGTKSGFRTLYASKNLPEKEKLSLAYDLRPAAPLEDAIGSECYGLSFSSTGYAYAIHRVMYDGPRSMAVGFLSISLYVPFEYKIEGTLLKLFLDNLMKEYRYFAPTNVLQAQTEDFTFVENLLDANNVNFRSTSKENKFSSAGRNLSSSKDAAFIFYPENKLSEYFDRPELSIYRNYRQVLFVETAQQNILLAIKHSDNITQEIDLQSHEYSIKCKYNEEVEVILNGEKINGEEKINLNNFLSIEFIKLGHKSLVFEDTFKNLAIKFPGLFSLDNQAHEIKIDRLQFQPIKTFKIFVSNLNHVLIHNDEFSILCESNSGSAKYISPDSIISFEGKEINELWFLKIKGKGKYNDILVPLLPRDHKPDIVDIFLTEVNKITKIINDKYSYTGSPNDTEKINKSLASLIISWCIKYKFYLLISAVIILVVIPIILTFRYGFPQSQKETQVVSTSSYINIKDSIEMLTQYCNGMDLNIDSLQKFAAIQKNDSFQKLPNKMQIIEKVNNAIEIRNAINGNSKDKIIELFKMNKLPPKQSALFRLIVNCDFEYFKAIANRKDLSLSVIHFKLDSITNERNSQKQESDKSNQPFKDLNVPSQSSDQDKDLRIRSVSNGKYSNTEFLNIIQNIETKSDVNNLKDDKLTQDQKNLKTKILSNISGFKNIKKLRTLNFNELRAQINNL